MAREIDDVNKRRKYKEQQYDGKKSRIDDYTGERVFAGNQRDSVYKHPTTKTSDTDHITPIKVVNKKYRRLSEEQRKTLVNNEKHNYATTNSKLNRSKGDLENHEYLLRQLKKGEPENLKTTVTMLAKEVDSRVNMRVEAVPMYVEHDSKIFVSGAKESLVNSVIPLTAIAVDQMCKVVKGEESFAEAIKDSSKAVVDVAVIGGTQKLVLDITNCVFKNSNTATQIVNVALVVKDSAIKYVNGEISGEQFLDEVGEKGTVMVAGMVGGAVGKEIGALIGTVMLPGIGTIAGELVGQILGTIITTVACSAISMFYSTAESLDNYKLKEQEIKIIEEEAIEEIERQRRKFKDIVEKENQYWDEEIKGGFEKIFESAVKEEFASEGVAEGLDRILKVFGKEVRFKTLEEYESQLDTTLILEF